MGWLGLDDTDSLAGGCTTETFHQLLLGLPKEVEVGEPRLVRLWPFAFRRTRGNAALAVELKCPDEAALLAHLDAWWERHLAPLGGRMEASSVSSRPQSPASPGMVWFRDAPGADFYWKAVRGDVTAEPLPGALRSWGGEGCIGATAAVAWPATTVTWEAIAWRCQGVQGPRLVDASALADIDGWSNIVFSRDPRRGHQLVAPRGNSPVLFGVRSRTKVDAERAGQRLLDAEGTEAVSGLRVFQTNQASGDHLDRVYRLTVLEKNVEPVRKHVQLITNGRPVQAYAEGGPVNALARWMEVGDVFEVRGLVGPDGVLHAEQLRLVTAQPRRKNRPKCPSCEVTLKSMGAGQGLRCPSCKERSVDAWVEVPAHPPADGWVEPEVDARRHLARPLEWDENGEGFLAASKR